MTAQTSATDLRPALRAAYLIAFDNFATDAAEVAKALEIERKDAAALLARLENAGLCSSLHVNGEKALTFQANETYDSISRTTAIRRFDKAFPKGQPVEPVAATNGRKAGTGPRYTDEQLKIALKMRATGATWKVVAAAVQIKSPAYLAKTLKGRNGSVPAAK